MKGLCRWEAAKFEGPQYCKNEGIRRIRSEASFGELAKFFFEERGSSVVPSIIGGKSGKRSRISGDAYLGPGIFRSWHAGTDTSTEIITRRVSSNYIGRERRTLLWDSSVDGGGSAGGGRNTIGNCTCCTWVIHRTEEGKTPLRHGLACSYIHVT